MHNIAMKIMYDGTDFHGWQVQKNGITVQETVESTLKQLTGEDIKVTGCSRTDAGVHALEYVFNFFTDSKIPVEKFPFAFNNNLKNNYISAVSAIYVPDDFNARYSSKGKRYIYKIHNSKTPNPFTSRYSWDFPYKLDLNKMKEAAKYFVGEYDFSSFMAAGGSQKTTVREVFSLNIENSTEWDSEFIVTIEANAYLYNMVRIIVGTLCDVGTGKIAPCDIKSIIESKERKMAGETAPPMGLHLAKVFYNNDINL